jgi:hypothetical protein
MNTASETFLTHPPTLGIDIGRVIIGAVDHHGHADTSFLSGTIERAMETPPTPRAFDCIARLTRAFDGAVWLVSKCGPRVQDKTRRWLDHWRFWAHTDIAPDHLRFCLKRRDKGVHCAALGITHFVDDRVDVLEHLRGQVPYLYLFGLDWKTRPVPAWATPVITWPEAIEAIGRSNDGVGNRLAIA